MLGYVLGWGILLVVVSLITSWANKPYRLLFVVLELVLVLILSCMLVAILYDNHQEIIIDPAPIVDNRYEKAPLYGALFYVIQGPVMVV